MLKKLMSCIREYKKPSVLTSVFIIFEVIIECFIPFITAKLINDLENGIVDLHSITRYGLQLILLALLSLSCGVLSGRFCAIASCGFAKNLRHDLFYKVQGFSFANTDKFSTSSLVTRLTTDVGNVQMSYMMIIRTAIRAPLMMTVAFIMSIRLGGSLAWIFAGVIPLLGTALFMIIRCAMPLFQSVFKKYDRLNESVQENIKGMRVVKTFVREDYEVQKFDRAATEVQKDFTRAEKIVALNSPVMQFFIHLTMILISFFASYFILNQFGQEGAPELGTLSGMITYSMQILSSLMMVSMIFVMISISIASAKRIVEVLDEESTLSNPSSPIYEIPDGSVDFENVSFKYSTHAEKFALQGIDLHIKAGQTVGILGGTGSSKTSLVQLIPRLYDVTEGAVKVGGIDVRNYDMDTLRNGVAVVLQKNLLFSGTIKENLRWGDPNASDEELERICRLAQAHEFISAFPEGYDTHIEQGGNNVSGGQKQRLCIARALLKKPKILILDDSTSAVDTKTDALIRQAFRQEIPGTTKFIIAQRVSSVQDADVILILENGQIVGQGSHQELLQNNEIYREVYESQNKKEEEAQ